MDIDALVDGEFRDKMSEAMTLGDEVEVMRELAHRVRIETLREWLAFEEKSVKIWKAQYQSSGGDYELARYEAAENSRDKVAALITTAEKEAGQ